MDLKDMKKYGVHSFSYRWRAWWLMSAQPRLRLLTLNYWWDWRYQDKLIERRRDSDRIEEEFQKETGGWEPESAAAYQNLKHRGLYDEILRRGIKIDPEWIDQTATKPDTICNNEYPYFRPKADVMMAAAIRKDRSANLWKWITTFVVPLLGAFIGAYLGSKK